MLKKNAKAWKKRYKNRQMMVYKIKQMMVYKNRQMMEAQDLMDVSVTPDAFFYLCLTKAINQIKSFLKNQNGVIDPFVLS